MYLAITALCGVTAASSVQWSVQMWSQRQGWLDGDVIWFTQGLLLTIMFVFVCYSGLRTIQAFKHKMCNE